jgi:predicted 3-demethylubiquinone-9 3-methyltransferase (glyoxalase superfamily)
VPALKIMQELTSCLWFNFNAKAAVNRHQSIFKIDIAALRSAYEGA